MINLNKFINYFNWKVIIEHFGTIIAILIVTAILIRIGNKTIENIFRVRFASRFKLSIKREQTLEKLLKNILTYVLYFIAFTMILDQLNIPVKTLLAGAGIVGIAIGFGAQNLVRDIITGFFIIFENQFSVGDYIRTTQYEGFVEEIGLRITKIKSWTGEVHILPNGMIDQVTNFSINNSVGVVDISIAYEEDIDRAEQVIEEVVNELAKEHEEFVKIPEILGVQTLGSSEVTIRVVAEVLPMTHWAAARLIRKAVKLRFNKENIEIPYPRIVTYHRENSQSGERSRS